MNENEMNEQSGELDEATDAGSREDVLLDELASAKDALLRRTAEMENMRRRHQQEREQWILEANRNIVTAILPTIDDLERTLEHARGEDTSVTQGLELVYKNLLKALERYGVKPMESVGQQFDPQQHDAMMQEPRTDVAPGTITTELQKGYLLGDKVLRHAKVFVAQEPQ